MTKNKSWKVIKNFAVNWHPSKLALTHMNKNKVLNPKDIYQKYCNGDKLTDMEIAYGIAHFSEVAKLLYISGPVFILAAREAMRIRDRLNEIVAARSNKSKT